MPLSHPRTKILVRKTQGNWNWHSIQSHVTMAHTRGFKGEEKHRYNCKERQLPVHKESVAVSFLVMFCSCWQTRWAGRRADFSYGYPLGELIPLCHKAEVRFCIKSHKSEKLIGKHLQSISFRANIHHTSKEEITCKVQGCGSGQAKSPLRWP